MSSSPVPRTSSAAQVRDGRVAPTDDPAGALAAGADLVWVALHDPSGEEVEAAVATLGLPVDLVLETYRGGPAVFDPTEPTRRRRARLVVQDGGQALVLLPATYDDDAEDVHLGLLTVVVCGAAALTVARSPAPRLDPVRHAPAPGDLGALLEQTLARALDDYESVLEQLDDDVSDVEAEVFSPRRRSRAQRIYGLKRETLQLARAVQPLGDVAVRLHCTPALRERVLRVGEHVERLSSLLDSVLDADLAQVGVRQNEDQRRISAWAAIALVPTIVAGIYGMNFQHMPELSWRLGYPGALLLIAVICSTLYRAFRHNGWLGPPPAADEI